MISTSWSADGAPNVPRYTNRKLLPNRDGKLASNTVALYIISFALSFCKTESLLSPVVHQTFNASEYVAWSSIFCDDVGSFSILEWKVHHMQ